MNMSWDKAIYRKEQAYVALIHVMMLDKLNVVNYIRKQICVSKDVEEELTRLCTKTLLPQLILMVQILSHDDNTVAPECC